MIAARGGHIILARTPHQADDIVEFVAVLAELFDRDGRRLAKEMGDDEIGPEAPGNIQHRRRHFDTRRRNGEFPAVVPFEQTDLAKDRQGLLASGIIVVKIGNLAAFLSALVLDKLHGGDALWPVGRSHRKDVGKAFTIRWIGAAKAGRDAGDFVFHMSGRQGVHDRCAVVHRRHPAIALDALISLNAAVGFIGVLHLDIFQRMTLDTAFGIDQFDVVGNPWTNNGANELRGACTVTLSTDNNLVRHNRRHQGEAEHQCQDG